MHLLVDDLPVAIRADLPVVLLMGMAVMATLIALLSELRANRAQRAASRRLADAESDTHHLRKREELFRALVASSSDVVTLVDATGRVLFQSTTAAELTGRAIGSTNGVLVESLVHPDDRPALLASLDPARLMLAPASIEVRLARSDGTYCLTDTTITNQLGNPAVGGLVLASRDIGERKELEEQLRHRAFFDALTGLGNRSLFRDELERAVARVRRYHTGLAVCFIDLDGFKLVNDTLGHDAGDRLLVEVARRIRAVLRSSDVVARMGGDEFAVLLEQGEDVRSPAIVAGRILAALQTPIEIDGSLTRTSASIGVDVTGGRTAATAEELLRNADLAMYRAKTRGKNKVEMYEPRLRDAALSRVRLEKELREGIDADELILHYQPIVSIPSGVITGVEALVRWHHPERGLVPPSDFIPVAEESGLIVDLGRWALRRACRDIAGLGADGLNIPVAVNVATRQLLQPGLLQAVRAAIATSGLSADRLVIEITEGALLDDSRSTASLLAQLRDQGIGLAIDDFGTGYSSLSRLRSFPVDKLKIDRSFIQEIQRANDRAPIVAAIMAMAHSLGLTAVAEGVETVDQLAALHQHGCEEIQGFLLSRPLRLEQLADILVEGHGMLSHPELEEQGPRPAPLDRLVTTASDAQVPVAERCLPLLVELCRQTEVAGAYLARVDRRTGMETIVQSHSPAGLPLTVGMEIPAPHPGSFRVEEGNRVAAVLAGAGVRALASVPVIGADDRIDHVFGITSSVDAPVPSQAVVLAELFTRLLADATAASSAAGRAPALDRPVVPAAR
jgi:diguanylate cyclase (GGDEF)-like protein/PAS domain S-box-containing protein